MSTGPSVIVNKKGGFLSALAHGVFGFLTATVVCVSGLGFYGLWVVNSSAGQIIGTGRDLSVLILETLPDWQKALPPALADAVNDRREPSYRDQLDVSVRFKPGKDHPRAVVQIKNTGDETVSLLMARIVVLDEDGEPIHVFAEPVATPLAFDDHDWPGPILPGSTRTVSVSLHSRSADEFSDATIEITELRIWNADPPQIGLAESEEG